MKEYADIIIMALGIVATMFILMENEAHWWLVVMVYFSGIAAGWNLNKIWKGR